MATYYKYAERNIQNDVNWAEIGKNLTDMLQEQNKLREDKKAAIDEASRQYGQVLESNPMGENDNLNKWSLEFASSAKEARLLQDRLLKRGILKVKDYTVMRQNLTDGTENAFGILKDWNAIYTDKMSRANTLKSAGQEVWDMEILDGLKNFSTTALYINPTDYTVSVGDKIKDPATGQMILNPDKMKYATISSLRARMNDKIDRFDVDGKLTAIVGTLGKYVKSETAKTGESTPKVIESILANPAYVKIEKGLIDQMMVDPRKVGSIMSDFLQYGQNGEAYTFTLNEDESKSNNNLIYVENDPLQPSAGIHVPKLTKEQDAYVREQLTLRLRSMLDYKETPATKNAPHYATEGDYARGDAKKVEKTVVTMLGKFYSGDASEVDAASRYFKGFDKGIQSINKAGKGLVITYNDGRPQDILGFKTANGTLMKSTDWIQSATVLSKMQNVTDAMKAAGLNGNEAYSTAQGGYSTAATTPKYTEAIIPVTDDKGNIAPKGLDDYFNSTFKRGTNYKFFSEVETAKNAAAVATTILGTLPPDATKQMSIKSEEVGDVTNLTIRLPNIMKGVVKIPMAKSANLEAEIKRIVKNIYDLASMGEEFSSSDALSTGNEEGGNKDMSKY